MYPELASSGATADKLAEDDGEDVEAEIQRELAGLKDTSSKALVKSMRLDIPCGRSSPSEAFDQWLAANKPASTVLQDLSAYRSGSSCPRNMSGC